MVTKKAATAALLTLFSYMTIVEPFREGSWYNDVRGRTALVETAGFDPNLNVLYPQDYSVFTGDFYLGITNWNIIGRPILPVYANGQQNRNRGYIVGWVYDNAGNQIRFYDSVTVIDANTVKITDTFPDGFYKAYFQLRRYDGTPVIQSNHNAIGTFCSTRFEVGGSGPPDDGWVPPDDPPPPDEPPIDPPPN